MPKTLQAERVLKGGREVSEQLTPETVKELVYLSSIECSLGWTPDEEQRVYHALPALLAAVRERDELKREVNDCRQIITTYADETELQQKRIAELEAEFRNIANAKTGSREWAESGCDFEGWAKSRARHALKGIAKQ